MSRILKVGNHYLNLDAVADPSPASPDRLTLILHAAQRLARAGMPVTRASVYREVRPFLPDAASQLPGRSARRVVADAIATLVAAGIGPFEPDVLTARDDEHVSEPAVYVPAPRELALAVAKLRCAHRLAGNGTHRLTEADRGKRVYRCLYRGDTKGDE